MADFQFLKNPVTGKPVILAPRRAKRTNVEGSKPVAVCPFCPGREGEEEELFRKTPSDSPFSGGEGAGSSPDKGRLGGVLGWAVKVLPNKFPFTPHHEIVVLSPDHHKGFDELPLSHIELILQTYRERYNANKQFGSVYIFHNGGLGSGESLPHPHSQIAVVPFDIPLEIPPLSPVIARSEVRTTWQSHKVTRLLLRQLADRNDEKKGDILETECFSIFCPETSDWPDEVWVAPKNNGKLFCEISNKEITELAFILSRLIQIFDLRHGHEFPFNFYIYPGKNWYLRLIPRLKILGGFELGTGVMINTQDPAETFAFIKQHFFEPDLEKIKKDHRADYLTGV